MATAYLTVVKLSLQLTLTMRFLATFLVPLLALASSYPVVLANVSRNMTVSALDRSILYTPAKHWAKTDNYMYAVANQSFAKFTFSARKYALFGGIAFYYYDAGIPPHHDGSVYKFSLDNGAESVHTWKYSNPSDSGDIQSRESTLIQAYTGL
ncbi:hypothetical protein BJ165DRAFT_1527300 [Panaeolus papilionaceus]|nr:hypothetical protein BJ165DRAFT_1527300 [Panaeolus papilionaceus]